MSRTDGVKSTSGQEVEFEQIDSWSRVRKGEISVTEFYAEQRERCPISRTQGDDGHNIWHLFRAEDVNAVLNNTELFSSRSTVARFGARMIPIETDPPEHTQYRRLLNELMSPRRLRQYETAVRATIIAGLDKLVAAGGGDIAELTFQIPFQTFCLLLGEEDTSFREADQERVNSAPTIARMDAESVAKRNALNDPLRQFCLRRLRACREAPNDTLASDIANGRVNGELLSEEEGVSILNLLYMAGHRSTAGGMQAAILALAGSPEDQDHLRAHPQEIPAAIEEALRLEAPVQSLPRHVKEDVMLGGREIKAGDQVCPVFAAANLDPEAFPEPAKFDIRRRPNHFTFGRGVHRCAGAQLARLQIRVLVEELLARTSEISLLAPPERRRWPHNHSTRLEVRLVGAGG